MFDIGQWVECEELQTIAKNIFFQAYFGRRLVNRKSERESPEALTNDLVKAQQKIIRKIYQSPKLGQRFFKDVVILMAKGPGRSDAIALEAFQETLQQVPQFAIEFAGTGRRNNGLSECERCRKRTRELKWPCKCGQLRACYNVECTWEEKERSLCTACFSFGTRTHSVKREGEGEVKTLSCKRLKTQNEG